MNELSSAYIRTNNTNILFERETISPFFFIIIIIILAKSNNNNNNINNNQSY